MLSLLNLLFSVDDSVVTYVNSFAHRDWNADYLICAVANGSIFKGGLVMTVYWWAWFRTPENRDEAESRNARDILLYTLLICVPAVLCARLMASLLPFRARPIHNPELHLKVAFTLGEEIRGWSWSSFPSDHAVLFCGLATGFYLVSRRMGCLMYLYTAVFILLPRIYLGYHYPTDILAGALLGVGMVCTFRSVTLRQMINRPAQRLQAWSPGLFYAGLIHLSYQTSILYEPMRHMALYTVGILRNVVR
jgi:membrane-associated phospholipid phosphatase